MDQTRWKKLASPDQDQHPCMAFDQRETSDTF